MLKKLLNLIKYDVLIINILGEKKQNLIHIGFSILPAIFAGLMEGISYGSLLLAVNVLRGEPATSLQFLSKLCGFVSRLSINKQFIFYITLALLIQFLRSSFIFISNFIVAKLSLKITTNLKHKINKQIFNFSYTFVSKFQAGDLINYNQSTVAIPAVLSSANNALIALSMGMISFLCLIKIDFILTGALIFFFFLVNFLYKSLLKKVRAMSLELSKDEVEFSAQANQNINGIKLIHSFNKQNYIVEKTKNILFKIASQLTKLTFWQTLIYAFGEIIGISVISLLLIFGAFLMHHKPSFLAYLLMYIFIAYRLATRMQLFMDSLTAVSMQSGNLKRIRDFIKEEDKEFIKKDGITFSNFKNEILFQNVSFTYIERNKNAIENVNFSIMKNQTTAFVGKSGSGKSTIIDLLLQLYSPTNGIVSVDSHNLMSISLESWRKKIGIVNQDVFLFHDTIENNIKFANENATEEEIYKVCEKAYANDFILKLPQKFKTIVGEKGQRLSGGERQRIALARALIKNPDILILDEATSQLDSYSEKCITNAIENLKKEKTIIVIAHRLSTIANADKIIVIDKGKIIETGNHNDLLKKKNIYYHLWNIQSQKKSSDGDFLDFDSLGKILSNN